MMRSQYILSFLPSLFSLLPPFFFHKLRQIHMGCKLWGVSPAGPPVSSWLSLSADEVTYFITPPCRYLKVEHDNAWIMGFLNSLPFEVLLFIYLGRGGQVSLWENSALLWFSSSYLSFHLIFPHSVSTPHSLLCQHHQISNTEESK